MNATVHLFRASPIWSSNVWSLVCAANLRESTRTELVLHYEVYNIFLDPRRGSSVWLFSSKKSTHALIVTNGTREERIQTAYITTDHKMHPPQLIRRLPPVVALTCSHSRDCSRTRFAESFARSGMSRRGRWALCIADRSVSTPTLSDENFIPVQTALNMVWNEMRYGRNGWESVSHYPTSIFQDL